MPTVTRTVWVNGSALASQTCSSSSSLDTTRPGRVISSEELLEHVWDANADPFTQTVRVTVGTLRRKLGDGWIETVVGRGYRLREEP